MNDVLICEQLEKCYNRGKPNEITVLKGLDLTIPKGQVVALVARRFGLQLGVRHDIKVNDKARQQEQASAPAPAPNA